MNDASVDGSALIQAGDRARLGITGPTIEILAIQPASQDGRISADFSSTVQADARHLALLRGTGRTERFALGAGGVIGRDAAVVQYHLDHPDISRLRASLVVDGKRVVLADLASSSGTYFNGRRRAQLTLRRPNTDDSQAFGTARVGRIDRSVGRSPCPRRSIDRSGSPRLRQISFNRHFVLATPCAHVSGFYAKPSNFKIGIAPPLGAGPLAHQQSRGPEVVRLRSFAVRKARPFVLEPLKLGLQENG